MSEEQEIGVVVHYFDKIGVAALKITKGTLSAGDTIHVKGTTSDFTTTIESMQIENDNIEKAKKGDSIGTKVPEKAREHDKVFIVKE